MDLGVSAKLEPILAEVKAFISEQIQPLEEAYAAEVASGERWTFTPRQTEIIETLKAKARARGLWNFFLTMFIAIRNNIKQVLQIVFEIYVHICVL